MHPPHDSSDVTVAVMTRNEAQLVGDIVAEVTAYAEEVLVVDGHSTDDTRERAEAAGARVLLDGGLGKGDGIRVAIREARTSMLVFIDCDGSHHTEDIPRLIAPLRAGDYDIVVGSRITGGSDEFQGDLEKVVRTIGSHIITLTVNMRFGTQLTDTQNGFRALNVAAARRLGLRENSFTVEQEMVMRALHLGLRVGEVPAHERERQHGQSHISLRRVWPLYGWSLLRGVLRTGARRNGR